MKTHYVPEMYNRGVRYLEKQNHAKALSFFRKETSNFKELYLNQGICWGRLGNQQKSIDCFAKAADPAVSFASGATGPYPEALNNLGISMYAEEQDLLAMDYYDAALEHKPDYHTARWHRSLAELRRWVSGRPSNHVRALVDYDFRFSVRDKATVIDAALPRWDGVTGGKSIVVLAEQGLGDTIQWLRYVVLLENLFEKVWVQIPTKLRPLYPHLNCVSFVQETDAEVCVPVCSLTRYFPIDAVDPHYLSAPTPFDFGGSGLKIGVVASGSPDHNNDHRRSCGISYFLELAGPGITLYNLQPGDRSVKGVVSLNPKTWLETASYLMGLDLLISVDTSVVHLAGTLGIPCWVLMPLADTDWRWGDSTCGEDNVWYPSVKVIRNPNSWVATFRKVKDMLNDFSSKP